MHTLWPLLAALAFGQANDPPPSPPPKAEWTEKKITEMTAGAREIRLLSETLRKLTESVEKRGPAVSAESHFRTSQRILKARGLLLVKLRVELEQALWARYQLELELEDYKRWVDEVERRRGLSNQKHQAQIEELRKKSVFLRYEGCVVAHLLRQKLEKKVRDLKREGKVQQAQTVQQAVDDLSNGLRDYELVANKEELERQYADFGEEALQARLHLVLGEIRDADFEARFLRHNLPQQSPDVVAEMSEARQNAIRRATEMLAQSRDWEDHAARVAIMSKHLRGWLADIAREEDIDNKMEAFKKKLHLEPEIVDALKQVASDPRPLDQKAVGGTLDLLLLPPESTAARKERSSSK